MSPRTRIAVVGFGLIGRRHVDVVVRSPKCKLAAIVDSNPASKAAAEDQGAPVYSDLSDMIRAESPDGIVLATPTPLHIEQGLTCIGAGCPTLIEKPIAVTSIDARLLTEAADKAGASADDVDPAVRAAEHRTAGSQSLAGSERRPGATEEGRWVRQLAQRGERGLRRGPIDTLLLVS